MRRSNRARSATVIVVGAIAVALAARAVPVVAERQHADKSLPCRPPDNVHWPMSATDQQIQPP